MKHCCVIGGGGFIGSHLIQKLLALGREITVIGRTSSSPPTLPSAVRYISGDYGNESLLFNALSQGGEIINLAYTTVPTSSFDDPVQDILNNLPSSVKLLDVACRTGVEKVVMVSSGGTVYGEAQRLPITEDHSTNPISPYGVTKLAIEKYSLLFWKLKQLPVVVVRPSNAFGEGQKPFCGQGLIATSIASILRRTEISLYGDNDSIRDYLHVSDLAEGIISALQGGTSGTIYNIGSGVGRSNREVLDDICEHSRSLGYQPRVKVRPRRIFDVHANVLDSTKLHRDTGWKPTISFSDGVRRAWNWYQTDKDSL